MILAILNIFLLTGPDLLFVKSNMLGLFLILNDILVLYVLQAKLDPVPTLGCKI